MSRIGVPRVLPLLLAFAAVPCFGQRTTATLYGNITDQTAASVPGAMVKVVNEDTGETLAAVADERGDFTVTFLPVGRYRLEVEARGFKNFSQAGIALSAGQQLRYALSLELGAATEKITVTAEMPVLQNASPGLNDAVSRLQLDEVPHGGRDFTGLLALQNGFRPARDGQIQLNGLASGGITLTVDGVDGSGSAEVSSPAMFQNFNPIKVMSEEAIQEVAVSKGVMSAEYAHTYSGNINLISKSGTNEFHGSLFETLRNSIFNAKNAALRPDSPKPPVHVNQFGGSLGGPIRKDKLFFFFTYEGYRQQTTGVSTGQVPTAEFRAQLLAAVPAYKQIVEFYPLPTSPIAGNTTVGLFQGLASTSSADNNVVAKGDYLISNNNRLSLRYNRLRPQQLNPRFPPTFRRDYTGINESGAASFVHSAPKWTAETRFGFNLVDVQRVETLWTNGAIPAIVLKNVIDTQGEGYFKRGHTYTIEEVVARNLGRHSLKMGGIYGARSPGNFDEQVPSFTYSNNADLLANRASAIQVTLPIPDYHARNWELGAFLQDDFRLKSNFMLNLGVRYEYFSVLTEEQGRLYNPDGVSAALARPVAFRPADSEYRADRVNFSPRGGFTWAPARDGKTVVRGGVGVFAAQPLLNNFTLVYTDPKVPSRFNLATSDINSLGLKYPIGNENFLKILTTRNVPAGYSLVDPNYRNPYSVQWSFDVQRQLTPTLAIQTGYVGNKGLKIAAAHNINLPDRLTGNRSFPDALQSQWLNNSDFSYYHAWETSVRKRLGHGLAFNAHYTWGKAISINEGDFYSGSNQRVQDETNWRANKGPATYDIAHRLVGDLVYRLPLDRLAKDNRVVRHAVGGWQISSTFNVQSGDRLDVAQKSNYDSSRPDYVGGNVYANSGDRFQWFNPPAFAALTVPKASGATARPGNVGKYAFTGPASWGTSISLSKSIDFTERLRLQIRADAFSAFNHPTLGNPQTEVTSATFGRILSVGGSRTMQMNARLTF
ncbi:MAG: TonB-dependent receptor [Acidobacteria bacterium]|nr:TonB-dependent receptor [Acidobacteriota bacterium]